MNTSIKKFSICIALAALLSSQPACAGFWYNWLPEAVKTAFYPTLRRWQPTLEKWGLPALAMAIFVGFIGYDLWKNYQKSSTSTPLPDNSPSPLQNSGNTCYLNAALQGLLSITPLTQIVSQSSLQNHTSSLISNYFKLLNASTIRDFNTAHSNFTNTVLRQMGTGQQDIDEFFDTFLGELKENNIGKNLLDYNLQLKFTDQTNQDITNTISSLGQGYATSEPNRNLLKVQFSDSLQRSLKTFFEKTISTNPILTGCSEQYTLSQAPQVLFVKVDRSRGGGPKIQDDMDIPFTLNSLTDLKASNSINYELISVIVHKGTQTGGHYTTFVKRNNQWWYCDDTKISPVSQEQLLNGGMLTFHNIVLGGEWHNAADIYIDSIKKGYLYIYQVKTPTLSLDDVD